eukprot:scaffold123117_cov42-Phaeocystis_antarctica.AAC.1
MCAGPPESGVRSPDWSGLVRSPESVRSTGRQRNECAVQTPSPEPIIQSPGTPKNGAEGDVTGGGRLL